MGPAHYHQLIQSITLKAIEWLRLAITTTFCSLLEMKNIPL